MEPLRGDWNGISTIHRKTFTCGHCNGRTSVKDGYYATSATTWSATLYICGGCNRPNYFEDGYQYPSPSIGRPVEHLPPEVDALWKETLGSARVGAHTAAVMTARALVMHVAVDKGATEGQQFAAYVTYLADNHHVPDGARPWLDRIRQIGNRANHSIAPVTAENAREALAFTEALLQMTYEFHGRLAATTGGVPPPVTPAG